MTDTPGLRPTPSPFRRSRKAADHEARFAALEEATRNYAWAGGPFNPAGLLATGACLLGAWAALQAGATVLAAGLVFTFVPVALLASRVLRRFYQRLGAVIPTPPPGPERTRGSVAVAMAISGFMVAGALLVLGVDGWKAIAAGAGPRRTAIALMASAAVLVNVAVGFWLDRPRIRTQVQGLATLLIFARAFRDLGLDGAAPAPIPLVFLPWLGVAGLVAGAWGHVAHRRTERRILEISKVPVATAETPPAVTTPRHPNVQALLDLDRVVHEPARLAILTVLSSAEEVEFKFLETALGLTRGNLSSHTAKLEEAGYLTVAKAFRDRIPLTTYRITPAGRAALQTYRKALLDGVRGG